MTSFTPLVSDLLSPVLADEEIELVDVEYQGDSKTLRLLIYKLGGVSIEDCRHVSQIASPILNVHGVIPGKYNLEVASPGLDRPLVTGVDFRRNLGQKIQVEVCASAGDFSQLSGALKGVSDGKIFLDQASGETIQVVISEITKAQIQLMW
jgi:ribosome maturation factor RimP